ncbi:hypothetical protein M0R45_001150 [Rubus argutus]|uniref:Uncharacterized protein n=1 Tax=Rubus argutus TaxID=59490 RepID=A0AAW1VN47_RUBAR
MSDGSVNGQSRCGHGRGRPWIDDGLEDAAALFFSLIAAAAWFDHGGWLDYGWAFVMVSEGRAGALCTGSDVWLFWVLLDLVFGFLVSGKRAMSTGRASARFRIDV